MAALLATERIIVGVTDDTMLKKKKHAQLLEDLPQRIAKVDTFISTFRQTMTPLKQDVVQLSDVCGPAGTEADVQALIVTDETIAGADMIKEERVKNGLGLLERYVIGVIGASGETDVKGDDAAALAASKVGSTAIRGWLAEQGQQGSSSVIAKDEAIKAAFGELAGKSRGIGESQRPVGANVPPLGLSNRALHSADEQMVEPPSASGQNLGEATRSVATALSRPPTEDELHSTTLWAEIHKLYGHGLELLALDVCKNGRLIASACQAKSEEHATVRIHDSGDSWKQIAVLEGHTLGVTRVRFSPVDASLFLSVSRDRTWRLWKRRDGAAAGDKAAWALLATESKAHARIVWDASWSRDGTAFATCSRDKTAKVWKLANETVTLQTTLKLAEPCTAIAFGAGDRLALGLESGDLLIYSGDLSAAPLTLKEHHTESVSELAWQPALENASGHLLLSSSEDGSTRLVRLDEA